MSGIICLSLSAMSGRATAQKSLTAYTGKYTRNIGGFKAYLNVYVANNKLFVKQWWDGKTRKLEYLNENRFIIALDGWAIEFKRDPKNRVINMQVLGDEIWTKV